MSDLCAAMEKFGKGIDSVPRYRIVMALFTGPKTVGELVKKQDYLNFFSPSICGF